MGMSTHVVGFRPPDEKWYQMKSIWDACVEASISVPDEVLVFFCDNDPEDAGIEVELKLEPYTGKGEEGYDVILSEVPKSVDRIRFYNSW